MIFYNPPVRDIYNNTQRIKKTIARRLSGLYNVIMFEDRYALINIVDVSLASLSHVEETYHKEHLFPYLLKIINKLGIFNGSVSLLTTDIKIRKNAADNYFKNLSIDNMYNMYKSNFFLIKKDNQKIIRLPKSFFEYFLILENRLSKKLNPKSGNKEGKEMEKVVVSELGVFKNCLTRVFSSIRKNNVLTVKAFYSFLIHQIIFETDSKRLQIQAKKFNMLDGEVFNDIINLDEILIIQKFLALYNLQNETLDKLAIIIDQTFDITKPKLQSIRKTTIRGAKTKLIYAEDFSGEVFYKDNNKYPLHKSFIFRNDLSNNNMIYYYSTMKLRKRFLFLYLEQIGFFNQFQNPSHFKRIVEKIFIDNKMDYVKDKIDYPFVYDFIVTVGENKVFVNLLTRDRIMLKTKDTPIHNEIVKHHYLKLKREKYIILTYKMFDIRTLNFDDYVIEMINKALEEN